MSKKAYNSDMSKRTLIVDFMYLWNRVYAIRGNETPKLVRATLKSMENSMYYDDKYIVLDGTNSVSLRRRVYPEYKASRGDKSDIYKLLNQFLQDISEDFKELKIIRNDNFEADDVITYLVKNSDSIVHIYSGDTDLFQLMRFPCTHVGTDYKRVGTFILTPIHEEEAKERYFKRYGINVKNMSYITKCKAFKGDTSDNIPGVPGIGEKTALTLIQKFGSIEDLYNAIDKEEDGLKGKQKEKITQNKDLAFLSKTIVLFSLTIACLSTSFWLSSYTTTSPFLIACS